MESYAFEPTESADRPAPDAALTGTGADTPDHDPRDSDDRVAEPDEPREISAPVDDDDRDPGKNPDASPATQR
jgi:hypothetical protein